METNEQTQGTARQRGSAGLMPIAGVAALALSGGLIAWGWTLREQSWAVLAAGGGGLIVTFLLVPIGLALSRRGDASRAGAAPEGNPEMRELARAIEQLAEQQSLSDEACRVLNRRRDRELLLRAIEEDIGAEDWDAAMVLVKELAERFGYRSEAEDYRQRIEQARFETVQRRVNEAIASLESLIEQRRWDQALVDAARIGRLYPDSPRVDGLRHRVEHARQLYKADLERRFLLAAESEHVDEAMGLLRELDAYLTEAEAEPFREVARGVIGKARDNLGVQFKLAVHDRRWTRAQEIGERIIEQFPNSRMAQEVRGMLDSIRARAGETARA
jgi:tetratricopeptide (TPR) repeat protein